MESETQPDLPLQSPAHTELVKLEQEEQKLRKDLKFWPLIIGLMVGVAVYSLVKNGLKWPTLFPLLALIPPQLIKNKLKQVRARRVQAQARAGETSPPA